MNTPSVTPRQPVIWERPEPEVTTPTPLPSREAVVRAAMSIADRHGLTAVSVRRLAGELGIGPMRLYRLFHSVEELTELMIDAAYGDIAQDLHPRGRWETRVRSILTRTRAEVLAHEWVADLLGTRQHLGPHSLAWMELLAAAIDRAPAITTADQAWSALGALNGFLVGAVRREVSDRRAGRVGAGKIAWQAQAAPYVMRMLDTGRFPTLRTLVVDRGEPDPDDAFRAELDIVLAGLDPVRRDRG